MRRRRRDPRRGAGSAGGSTWQCCLGATSDRTAVSSRRRQGRFDGAHLNWGDDVDGDAVGAELAGPASAHADDDGLGGRVDPFGVGPAAVEGGDRGDVDDAPDLLRGHPRRQCRGDQPRQHPIELISRASRTARGPSMVGRATSPMPSRRRTFPRPDSAKRRLMPPSDGRLVAKGRTCTVRDWGLGAWQIRKLGQSHPRPQDALTDYS